MTLKEVQDIVTAADKDGTGSLNVDEFADSAEAVEAVESAEKGEDLKQPVQTK